MVEENINNMNMEPVDRLMRQAIEGKVFPGGVLLVSKMGRVVFTGAYGITSLSSRTPVTSKTIFDLASLTKPLATTLAIMRLVQDHRLRLEQRLGQLLPEFQQTGKANIHIEHLLYHNSGLPDYRPYYKALDGATREERRNSLRKHLVQEELVDPIGETVLYSDLGFMILAWVIEQLCGRRLDHFVTDEIYRPLSLEHLFFIGNKIKNSRGTFAATEDCPWRSKVLEGRVHDENAYAVGGVEGHAGLFGSADDINSILTELLFAYQGRTNTRLFRQGLVQHFFKRLPGTDKALGFDMPSCVDSSSGKRFSENSVGHLGFTGTSFWLDLEQSVIVILLTNRVHPTRKNERIKKFRPELHDAVMDAIV